MKDTPTYRESLFGFSYLAFQFLLLPWLLLHGNAGLSQPLSEAQLNFVFYAINFLAALLIFFPTLLAGCSRLLHRPFLFLHGVILGLTVYFVCRLGIEGLLPAFANQNDTAIAAMGQDSPLLTCVGTVLLVPVYEECIYRGLIFRKLCENSVPAAYLLSALIFAGIHIFGYVGQYSPAELFFATVQYLPAGPCLGWAYRKTDSIFAPIAIHALVNFFTLSAMR